MVITYKNAVICLVLVGLFIASQSSGDEFFMKGVSWHSGMLDIQQMKELGANAVHPNIRWITVEPVILDASLTVDAVNGNPDLISDYPVNWTAIDNKINTLVSNGFLLVPWLGTGFTVDLPRINGVGATPDELGKEQYLGCIYRHVRAVVRRYKDRVHYWTIENELNEAQLAILFGWRAGGAWNDEEFAMDLIAVLHDAIIAEDPTAEIGTVFHTDIHEGIHHDFRPVHVNGSTLAGPYHWTEWLGKWAQYISFVGINSYPNYYTADPIYGTDAGERVAAAKAIVPDKPVIVFETAYSTPAPGVNLLDPMDFTEEKQAQYIEDAINSTIENGGAGFFHFILESQGITAGYTSADRDALNVLGSAFRNGDAEALIDFLFANFDYCYNVLPRVLMKVEQGFGLIRSDGSKRPSFYVLQDIFSTIPDPPSLYSTFTCELEAGFNLISLPLQPLDTSLDSVLASIQGEYDSVWTYDAITGQWLKYVVEGPPPMNNLHEVKPGVAYWVMMKHPSSLVVQGIRTAVPVSLYAGRNLIGFSSLTAQILPEALSSIAGSYESVWMYDAVDGRWKKYYVNGPNPLNDLTKMEPGKGYWINMYQSDTLIIQ